MIDEGADLHTEVPMTMDMDPEIVEIEHSIFGNLTNRGLDTRIEGLRLGLVSDVVPLEVHHMSVCETSYPLM